MQGFDCSGLVEELLLSAGVVPFGMGKMNAQMIFDFLITTGMQNVWGPGSIAFFGPDAKHIDHVGFCVDQYRMIEAGGGRADTTSLETAIAHNAFVKLRPIKYRRDFLAVVKPRYSAIGLI